ncbi:hypothetical protein [Mucilaginibacter terrae]|uniref:J domain-containing protein n=1 Tax=Mucilaginibacter terrae TaxID=1955052 RepID=A0ABU3GY94_9SPHI|nr:hypothetical protein [Mucilaginibacter terrae]MDT3404745.1 hypothetical protein [Mucilaginibacter terrae]
MNLLPDYKHGKFAIKAHFTQIALLMKPAISENNKSKKNQSKFQLKYEKLLSQIECQQEYNANLENGLQKAHVKITAELEPLMQQNTVLKRKLLLAIDGTADRLGVGKQNKEWLDIYMTESSEALLRIFGYQDKQVAAILEKYGNISVDDIVNDYESQSMSKKFNELYGFDINIKEMLEKGEENYFAENRHHFNKTKQAELDENPDEDEAQETRSKSKTAIKKAEEDKVLTRDARSVYMRLIKKFHPDLERDEDKRNEFTEIVKQVTKSYQENDFFALLKLQIQYLDDNETKATKIADDMLKRYNKILQKQLNELKQWIAMQHYMSGDMIEDFIDKNGSFSPQKFATQRNYLKKGNDAIKMEIEASIKRPKTWFKDYLRFIKDVKQEQMMQDMVADMYDS